MSLYAGVRPGNFHRHCVSLFFFRRPRHPRGLPSFPTRRSSDLAVHETALPTRTFSGALDVEVERAAEGDRKSTRLNSSHRCISYAVFCLKKKNTARELRISE